MSHTLRGCVDWNKFEESDKDVDSCHTLRGCVDWNMYKGIVENRSYVTPCVGVWIETIIVIYFWFFQTSHPAWVCGLKHL